MKKRRLFQGVWALTLVGAIACGEDEPGVDAGPDSGVVDTGRVDTGVVDTGVVDTGVVDTGIVDTGTSTTAPPDWDMEVRLPVAPDINPDPAIVEVDLEASVMNVELTPGVTTEMWAYNGSIPGPIITADRGDRLIVNFTNNLPVDTTVHWHGVDTPAVMDGSNISQLGIAPAGTLRYEFDILQASTHWYHPHVRTNIGVEQGLQAPMILRDPAEDAALGLPEAETTLILDDVLLNGAGQIAEPFPADPIANAATQVNGRMGDLILVNGKVLPTLTARSGVPFRLRLINTANARFFRISMEGATVHRIGGDSGLLAAAEVVQPVGMIPDPDNAAEMISDPNPDLGILLTPGERAEVVVTVTGAVGTEIVVATHDFPRGKHHVMSSTMTPSGIALGHAHDDGKGAPSNIFRIELVEGGDPGATPWSPPATLRPVTAIDATGAAPLPVIFGHTPPNAEGNINFFARVVDGRPRPFMVLTSTMGLEATIGETRIWEVVNLTGGDPPFHPHGFSFQLIETEYIDANTPGNNRVVPAPIVENKDTIRVPRRPGAFGTSRTIMRLAVVFDDSGRTGMVEAHGLDPTATTSGGWIAHCHVLEHSARGMMTFLNLRP